MDKNLKNVLRLAGLLKEQDEPGLSPGGAPPSPGGAPGGPPEGAEGGGDDPASLLDQAIDLLNKVKAAMSGGGAEGGAEVSGPSGPGGMGPGGPPSA